MMNMRSDKLLEIKIQFLEELSHIYEPQEVESIFYIILDHYTGLKRVDLALNPDKSLSEEKLRVFSNALTDLKSCRPVQQITGVAFFFDLKFKITRDVLIPRPETEELVAWIIEDFSLSPTKRVKLLDIGSGSGCIPVSLKHLKPEFEVQAVDISRKALEVARDNAHVNQTEICFRQLDILNMENWGELDCFDIIVSNPPYIKNSERKLMNRNVLDFEPEQALFVEDHDPLLFYREIATFGLTHLKEEGLLYFEINEAHGQEMKHLLSDMGYTNIIVKKDIFGKNRMTRATRP